MTRKRKCIQNSKGKNATFYWQAWSAMIIEGIRDDKHWNIPSDNWYLQLDPIKGKSAAHGAKMMQRHIHRWDNIPIKDGHFPQLYQFSVPENLSFLGGTKKVILKFTRESQGPRTAELSEKSGWVTPDNGELQSYGSDTATGQESTQRQAWACGGYPACQEHTPWGRGYPINLQDNWLSGWERRSYTSALLHSQKWILRIRKAEPEDLCVCYHVLRVAKEFQQGTKK